MILFCTLGVKPFPLRTLKTCCIVFWLSLLLMRRLVPISFRWLGISLETFLSIHVFLKHHSDNCSSGSFFILLGNGQTLSIRRLLLSLAPGNFFLTLLSVLLLSIFCSHFPEILVDVRSLNWASVSVFHIYTHTHTYICVYTYIYIYFPVFWLYSKRFSWFYLLSTESLTWQTHNSSPQYLFILIVSSWWHLIILWMPHLLDYLGEY